MACRWLPQAGTGGPKGGRRRRCQPRSRLDLSFPKKSAATTKALANDGYDIEGTASERCDYLERWKTIWQRESGRLAMGLWRMSYFSRVRRCWRWVTGAAVMVVVKAPLGKSVPAGTGVLREEGHDVPTIFAPTAALAAKATVAGATAACSLFCWRRRGLQKCFTLVGDLRLGVHRLKASRGPSRPLLILRIPNP